MDDYEPPGRAPGAEGLQGRPKGCGELGDVKGAGVWHRGPQRGQMASRSQVMEGQLMGQEFVFCSESSRGPCEGMEHRSGVLRFLQLMCRERPEDSQGGTWECARMNEKTGAGPSGPASSAVTARS